jgi:hypothetical protein
MFAGASERRSSELRSQTLSFVCVLEALRSSCGCFLFFELEFLAPSPSSPTLILGLMLSSLLQHPLHWSASTCLFANLSQLCVDFLTPTEATEPSYVAVSKLGLSLLVRTVATCCFSYSRITSPGVTTPLTSYLVFFLHLPPPNVHA